MKGKELTVEEYLELKLLYLTVENLRKTVISLKVKRDSSIENADRFFVDRLDSSQTELKVYFEKRQKNMIGNKHISNYIWDYEFDKFVFRKPKKNIKNK